MVTAPSLPTKTSVFLEQFLFSRSVISAVGEGIVEVIGCDFHQGVVDGIDYFAPTAWPKTAYPLFEFGKYVFDRVEIRRVRWQVDHLRADTLDRGDCRHRLMAAEVVENDQVAWM